MIQFPPCPITASAPTRCAPCAARCSLAITFSSTARRDWEAASPRPLARVRGFREEWYAAVELTGIRPARPFQTPAALSLYGEIIVTGAWWDIVRWRGITSRRRSPAPGSEDGGADHAEMEPRDDIWKRRTAILSQIKHMAGTDLELLYDCIEPSIGSREFFLRKGVGWALREYAYVDPREVLRYVARESIEAERIEQARSAQDAAEGRHAGGQFPSPPAGPTAAAGRPRRGPTRTGNSRRIKLSDLPASAP